MLGWLAGVLAQAPPPLPLEIPGPKGRLVCTLHGLTEEDECLLVLREESDIALIHAFSAIVPTHSREAEVLYWVVCGKTNRDIGDILGISHRTINKHMEHLFEKLGVETRTAAAAMAMRRLRLPAEGWIPISPETTLFSAQGTPSFFFHTKQQSSCDILGVVVRPVCLTQLCNTFPCVSF